VAGDRLVITDGDADTEAIREYEATRRDLVRRGLLFGGLTVAAAGVPTLLSAGRAFAQADGDTRILTGALGLEQTAVLVYDAARKSGRLRPVNRDVANLFGDQERQHADALVTALEQLGGTPPAGPARAGEVDGLAAALAGGQRTILEFAVALEEMAIAAYYQAQRKLADSKLLQTAATIMANEGQHLVVLRQALKENPLPTALETGRSE
jgi:rubrerythrin